MRILLDIGRHFKLLNLKTILMKFQASILQWNSHDNHRSSWFAHSACTGRLVNSLHGRSFIGLRLLSVPFFYLIYLRGTGQTAFGLGSNYVNRIYNRLDTEQFEDFR